MDASKLTNGSRAEVLVKRSVPPARSSQPTTVRSEAKKVGRIATGKKDKTVRPQVNAIRKSKSEKLVCRYCGSDDLVPSFIKRMGNFLMIGIPAISGLRDRLGG